MNQIMVQLNSAHVKQAYDESISAGGMIMETPNITGEYWLARVPVSDTQAIVCFPKFGTIGIGFQVEKEEDWNTNLPWRCSAEEIYAHIYCNKGDKRISKKKCIDAIQALRAAIKKTCGFGFLEPGACEAELED